MLAVLLARKSYGRCHNLIINFAEVTMVRSEELLAFVAKNQTDFHHNLRKPEPGRSFFTNDLLLRNKKNPKQGHGQRKFKIY